MRPAAGSGARTTTRPPCDRRSTRTFRSRERVLRRDVALRRRAGRPRVQPPGAPIRICVMSNRDEQFRSYVITSRPALLRTATLLTAGDTHLAEDLVQTTLT